MPFKDILVQIDTSPASHGRLRLACEIARRHTAQLTALYCVEPLPALAFSPWGDPGFSDFPAMERAREAYRAAVTASLDEIETAFRTHIERAGIRIDWRVAQGPGAAPLVQHARCADLAVIGQAGAIAPEELVLASGRPALIVPAEGRFEVIGQRVVIAWNASREAARAVADAFPLLADAAAITILSIAPADSVARAPTGADVVRHLARHAIEAAATTAIAEDADAGAAILSRAAEQRAGLIVMGAYGHSRTREWLLGGATRHLLRRATVPVLMAH